VLLVEDNELNQQVAQELLREVGVDVDVVADGQQGWSGPALWPTTWC
jgi:two-component system sensor histidine kinase/response regulator